MALSGTLDDFGIAEILQLIGQQTKNGQLRLRSRGTEVRIWFEGGDIVAAEQRGGKEGQLLGHLLVRAGLIKERDLEDALDDQRRTLRRLGDILVARGVIQQEDLEEMARLQVTEILYGLFTWKTGAYEFEVGEEPKEKGAFRPIRAEAILMEGFRMVDEWPLIRHRLPSRAVAFEKVKALPERSPDIDVAERRVHELVKSSRSVDRLIELSRLGEFETCKALCNLLDLGLIEERQLLSVGNEPRPRPIGSWVQGAGIWLGLIALVAAIAVLAWTNLRLVWGPLPALAELEARTEAARVQRRVDVHHLETGAFPEALEELDDGEPRPTRPGEGFVQGDPSGVE